jgi:hypothetical protein
LQWQPFVPREAIVEPCCAPTFPCIGTADVPRGLMRGSRAVQAMNKIPNCDGVFTTLANGGTPMNNANMPAQFDKSVPNVFPADSRALQCTSPIID